MRQTFGLCAVSVLGMALGEARGVSSASSPPRPEADEAARQAIDRAVDRVYPALVRIHVVTVGAAGGRLEKFESAGSGAIITRQGHVITNHHVAGKAKRIVCRMPDGEEIEATLVGTDPLADIAVVKLKADGRKTPGNPLPVAVFGDSDKVRVGDTVLAMGSPVALSQSVTRGIVSNTAMIVPEFYGPEAFKLDGEDVGSLVRWIGHDADIYGGNSGGPLVDLDGRIVGINEVGIGLGGAIPSNLAKSVADQIIATGQVKRSWTGLECQPRLKECSQAKGILVGGVIPDSPAAKAGLRPGDILTEFDGHAVDARIREDLPLFNRLVLSTPIGKAIKVTAIREGKPMTLTLTTAAREAARGEDQELKSWGMTARNFTLMSALERERPDKKGVLVSTLQSGGPCTEAKPPIDRGDVILEVNGKPVDHIDALRAISREVTEGKDDRVPVLVGYERKTQKLLTVVKIGKEPPEDEPVLARKAWLPAATQVLTRDLSEALGVKGKTGVRVTQVYTGHAAEKAGMKVGDLLLKLDGDRIEASQPEDVEVLPNMVQQCKIGTEVTFEGIRDRKPLKLTLKLEAPPTPPSELKRHKDDRFELAVRELSFDDRVSRKIDASLRGVLVDRVDDAGWAALAKLNVGDILLSINGEPTPNVDTVEELLNRAVEKKSKRIAFFIRRGIHTMYLELEPSWDIE
ncbi:MAG: PDZ domain-containing protein [Phycisphaerae bacterium]|nr:PDZ domain-containing protein [Phycisphaerae bacterium]